MTHSAENDAPFFWDTDTGKPCLRRGNVLCVRPYSPDHRHAHREPHACPTCGRVGVTACVDEKGRDLAHDHVGRPPYFDANAIPPERTDP